MMLALQQLALDALGQSAGNTHEAIVALDSRVRSDRALFDDLAPPLVRQAIREAVAHAVPRYREQQRRM